MMPKRRDCCVSSRLLLLHPGTSPSYHQTTTITRRRRKLRLRGLITYGYGVTVPWNVEGSSMVYSDDQPVWPFDEPLIGLFARSPPNEVVYSLAGPSFRQFYFGVAQGESVLPDWHYFHWDDAAAAAADATEGEEEPDGKLGDNGEDVSKEEYIGFLDVLPKSTPYVHDLLQLDIQQQVKLYERQALYRGRACKLLQGHSIDSLDDAKLQRMYPPERLKEKGYFTCYEENGSLGWFFHPDHCKLASLDDYQRLVLLNDGCYEYMDWDSYRCSYHTHEIDREYVKYCETISKEIRWLEDYVALDSASREEWDKLSNRAARQAMKIATRFTKISVGLAHPAFMEYKSRLSFNFHNLKELDGVFFEIWKRVIKQQSSFKEALKEVYELNEFPLRQGIMKYVLNHGCSAWETKFHTCTAGIQRQVDEIKARWLIKETLVAMFKRSKGYEEYARKKLKIAELIGLIPKYPIASGKPRKYYVICEVPLLRVESQGKKKVEQMHKKRRKFTIAGDLPEEN